MYAKPDIWQREKHEADRRRRRADRTHNMKRIISTLKEKSTRRTEEGEERIEHTT